MIRIAAVLFLVLGLSVTASAKARFAGKEEMVREAEAIVVVTITKVEKAEAKGKHWTYAQKATVEQCLKGGLTGAVDIYGQEDFICARCDYKPGRFLLFLRKDGGLWSGSNGHLGIRPVKEEKVVWFKPGGNLFETSDQPLADVLAEIRKLLDAPGPAPK